MGRLPLANQKMRYHGGKPVAERELLDFSTSLNPLGPPPIVSELVRKAVSLKLYTRYPDYDYTELRKAIAEYYGLDGGEVIPLNGSGEAYTLLIASLKPSALVVLEPCYGDHNYYASVFGVKLYPLKAYVLGEEGRIEFNSKVCEAIRGIATRYERLLVVLSNPNNPTGFLLARRIVEDLLSCAPNALLVADEAYMDFSPRSETFLGTYDPQVIVLRSFTKILSIPGLRAGFLYTANQEVLEKIEAIRQPWNVNSIAEYVLAKLLKEYSTTIKIFIEDTVRYVEAEKERLTEHLAGIGIQVYSPSHAPYILVRHPSLSHPKLNQLLLEKKIRVRNASSFNYLDGTYSRISVKTPEENDKLVKAFSHIFARAAGQVGYAG